MQTTPPKQIEWQTEPAEADQRLDRVLTAHIEEASRSYVAGLIERGHVRVNGETAIKTSHKLKVGDVVSVSIPPPEPSKLEAEDIPLSIVYEDADFLVVDKPAGMVVHPAPGHSGGTLVNAILAHVPNLELDMGDEARPGIVHRLDKDTSGLIVVAKRRAAHEILSRQMAAHTMRKEYLALVRGKPVPAAGIIDAAIDRDPKDRQRMAVVEGGRAARTRYTTEQNYGPHYTLVRAVLETGRTHQIRVHMASTGHAVIGDPVYGKATLKHAERLGLHRQFLHATRLGLTIPSSGEWREFESKLPEDLQGVLDQL